MVQGSRVCLFGGKSREKDKCVLPDWLLSNTDCQVLREHLCSHTACSVELMSSGPWIGTVASSLFSLVVLAVLTVWDAGERFALPQCPLGAAVPGHLSLWTLEGSGSRIG